MTKRPANSYRAFFRASLLSFLLLWCAGFAPLPVRAASDTAPPGHSHSQCIACDPTSDVPHHATSDFCNVLPHAAKGDLAGPLDFAATPAATHPIVFLERVDVARPRAATCRPPVGPPLYLSLQRLLN